MIMDDRDFLKTLFDAAVAAADPVHILDSYIPAPPKGRTIIIGAGKGSAQLAAEIETRLEKAGHHHLSGCVVTRYGFGTECQKIKVMEAAHPVPDAAGLAATATLFDSLSDLTADDLVIALITGGGSALLPAPIAPLTLKDEISLNSALLASGAPISVMNGVRKQISAIKGGKLAAAAYPAPVLSLIVSDVPGDDPSQVASGPTVADNLSRTDAIALAKAYHIQLPDTVAAFLANAPDENLTPDDPKLAHATHHVIASAAQSLEAAAAQAQAQGINAVILSDAIEGEARDIGLMHAAMAREIVMKNRPFQKPVLLLSGGETSVRLSEEGKRAGRGGRNTEFLLSFARAIDGLAGITALAADTDGIDGSEDNAGAFADGQTCTRMREAGQDPAAALAKNDAFGAFQAAGDLLITGPTGTNVNDFRAILIR